MRLASFVPAGVGTMVGAAGGGVFHGAGFAPLAPGLLLGGLYGLVLRCWSAACASSPGAGLLWGLAFFLLLWLAGPATLLPIFHAYGRVLQLWNGRAPISPNSSPTCSASGCRWGLPWGWWVTRSATETPPKPF